MLAREKPSLQLRRCSLRLKLGIRRRSWRQPKSWRSNITMCCAAGSNRWVCASLCEQPQGRKKPVRCRCLRGMKLWGAHACSVLAMAFCHFEKPWEIYAVTITSVRRRTLSPQSRTTVLNAWRHFHKTRYELFALCVMPDHVHALLQPWPKNEASRDETRFWSLAELMRSLKSFT